MTALTIIRREDAIVMASDGALVDEGGSGAVIGYRSKVLLLPESSAVVGFRGHAQVWDILHSKMRALFGFDTLLSGVTDLFEITVKLIREKTSASVNATLIMGGWSPARNAFETYRISSCAPHEPFALASLPVVYAEPMPSPEACRRFGVASGETLEDHSHLVLRLISAARSEAHVPVGGGPPVRNVGGFLQLTVLKQGVVDSRIVHGWPDAIGAKIDPTRGDALPAFLDPGKVAHNESRLVS